MNAPIPTIHINGSSPATLVDGLQVAINALAVAIETVQDAAPNARDYDPQGDGAFCAAAECHRRRLTALRDVHAELTANLRGIVRQLSDAKRKEMGI